MSVVTNSASATVHGMCHCSVVDCGLCGSRTPAIPLLDDSVAIPPDNPAHWRVCVISGSPQVGHLHNVRASRECNTKTNRVRILSDLV